MEEKTKTRIYRNPEYTICIETNKYLKDYLIHKDGDPIPEIEAELRKGVKINVGYLKEVLNLLDDLDNVKISIGQEDTPIHLEIKNKFKICVAPVVEV